MPTYDVLLTREATESANVRVQADNPEKAEESALAAARANPQDYRWEIDDNVGREVYVGDPGSCAEEVEPRVAKIDQLSDSLAALEREFDHDVQLAFDEVLFEHIDTSEETSAINNDGYRGQVEALANVYSIVRTAEIVEAFVKDWRDQHGKAAKT